MTEALGVTRDERGLVTLTLQRPERRNALGRALVAALRAELGRLASDPSARVVILAAQGEVFCAGADLKERAEMPQAEVAGFVDGLRAMMDELAGLPQPTVAALQGPALGGGCELALACDLRVMGAGATLSLPETHLGILPGAGGTQRLARLVGASRAKELIYTARRVGPAEALGWGLCNAVAGEEGAWERARALAETILGGAPIALAQAKRAVDEGVELPLEEGLAVERRCYAVTIPTEDRLEALAAFREKRKPRFQGR
jgi:methylglutaconyl-CoA hydratase